jgi:hypothetical protein
MPYEYSNELVEYKYITTDFLTDAILAEIPLQNVSFTRALKDAGGFSGSIPVIEDNDYLDLYETTIPGRTSLYVLRNGVCVWGGIIWSRTYDIKQRVLNVNASEFTSYLYKRVAWKTWNQELDATITTTGTGRQARVDITSGSFGFTTGMPVQLNFTEKLVPLTNIYTINSSPSANSIQFYVTLPSTVDNASTLTDVALAAVPITVSCQVDTYDYLTRLLGYINTDFSTIDFPNTEIAPEYNVYSDITNYARTSNIATIATNGEHGLVVGQTVQISGLPVGFNAKTIIVSSVPSSTTFTYTSIGDTVSSTAVTGTTKTASSVKIESITETSITQNVTITTSTSHSFLVGNIVRVVDVDPDLDGTHIITAVTSTTVTYQLVGLEDAPEITLSSGTASSGPVVKFGTYGSYTAHSDINIQVQTPDDATYSGKYISTETLRGSSLVNIGDHLDKYTNTFEGFEYRIDCSYSSTTNTFSKTFVVVPLDPLTQEQKNELDIPYPIEAFGAQKVVFEHPGNILEASMEENSNDSATRFWVQGKNENGVNDEAGEPYAGVAMSGLLADGWPILDDVETYDSNDEYVLADYATRYLEESTPPISNFSITVNGSVQPVVGTYSPGDWCSVIIDDVFVQLRMASGLEPRDHVLVRKIDAYTVNVPNSPAFPETVQLELFRESGVDPLGN